MNPIIDFFQGLAAQVPDLFQPFIIAAAGAIPFIEGEISSIIGVWAGMNPVLAGIAGPSATSSASPSSCSSELGPAAPS
ncbi:hypothetical protein BI49514_01638 [Brevibacterium iodinum ATCC 49514]|uniref:Uncharacterized protein n=1 Tax=Brevibacterium iodinum ATCC 49514 TaxID=1255616 RepID=A0A2H1J5N2_9MICO|nr:hypothetical protein [Brevibacterium iodinum]SMX82661.1 hypothetical protein BI49514_01638 [Brevibacterium iodinum ATCC 49514]SUW14304.1 Uncharacterised protein [Brevibacterium iodinum]